MDILEGGWKRSGEGRRKREGWRFESEEGEGGWRGMQRNMNKGDGQRH